MTDYTKLGVMKAGVVNANGCVYTQEAIDNAMEKYMGDRKDAKSGPGIINQMTEGGLRRGDISMFASFNSRYGSMGSGNTLYCALTKSLFSNLEQCDSDSWIITETACKAVVKEVLNYEIEKGYDNIPKAVLIGTLRPYVWLDDRTDAIPEDGYSLPEFIEFLRGMLDLDQLREMDVTDRKMLLNARTGEPRQDSRMEFPYPGTLTSDCRMVLGKRKVVLDPNWMERYQEFYPEGNDQGTPASRVAIVGHGGIGRNALKQHLTNVAVGVLSDMNISYPFADVAEVPEDVPQTVKGNGRQLIIDNGNGKSWPAAKTRKGHRRG